MLPFCILPQGSPSPKMFMRLFVTRISLFHSYFLITLQSCFIKSSLCQQLKFFQSLHSPSSPMRCFCLRCPLPLCLPRPLFSLRFLCVNTSFLFLQFLSHPTQFICRTFPQPLKDPRRHLPLYRFSPSTPSPAPGKRSPTFSIFLSFFFSSCT